MKVDKILESCILLSVLFDLILTEQNKIYYEILSQGEEIKIPLQNYFSQAKRAKFSSEKSTPLSSMMFEIQNSQESTQSLASDEMTVESVYGEEKLSDHAYLGTKSIFNQPVKIFLLDNNYVMMYIYREHCSELESSGEVLGLNLTSALQEEWGRENGGGLLNASQINCSSMETETTSERDLLYISCRILDKKPSLKIVEINLVHDSKSYIQKMQINSFISIPANKITDACPSYSLKLLERVFKNNSKIPDNSIVGYCSAFIDSTIFYFNSEQPIQYDSKFTPLKNCLNGARYISMTNTTGGTFISIINDIMYEYYTVLVTDNGVKKSVSSCNRIEIMKLDFTFAASRLYGTIQMHYFFLKVNGTNTIVIKSSYKTNSQPLTVGHNQLQFKSYAISQHFMGLTLGDGNRTLFLVYDMDELYPNLVDEGEPPSGSSLDLISAGNYLEKGFYFFFYDWETNVISLNKYVGYLCTIRPTSNFMQYQDFKYPWFIVMEIPSLNSNDSLNEELNISIYVKNFSDPSLNLNYKADSQMLVDDTLLSLNFSEKVVGPLQRFYFQHIAQRKQRNIKLHFINYHNEIDISAYQVIRHKLKNGSEVEMKLKTFSIDNEVKISETFITFYYDYIIQNCAIHYETSDRVSTMISFCLSCSSDDAIQFDSGMPNSSVIVLARGKWMEYNSQYANMCTINVDSVSCISMNIHKPGIRKIKLVKFKEITSRDMYIEIFILFAHSIEYGYFSASNNAFAYSSIFYITQNQISSLEGMEIQNIHYDKGYDKFLLIHLQKQEDNNTIHKAMLYDRPKQSNGNKFIGHLIDTFQNEAITAILAVGDLLVIVNHTLSREGLVSYINEYQVTDYYSIEKKRIYPVYDSLIVQNGDHISDGKFIYIQIMEEQFGKNVSKYLVYCPSFSTTNILTHKFTRKTSLAFAQIIGGSDQSPYPHSLGIHDSNLFSLSTPNALLHFKDFPKSINSDGVEAGSVVKGSLNFSIVDYRNLMHEIEIQYRVDKQGEEIKYLAKNEQNYKITEKEKEITYTLNTSKIMGPVMSYSVFHQNVNFRKEAKNLTERVEFQDVFTKKQCLLNINSKKYGKLLDFTTFPLELQESSIDIIITTHYLLCVEAKEQYKINILENFTKDEQPPLEYCEITKQGRGQVFIVCDESQKTVIKNMYVGKSCFDTKLSGIERPSWLVAYQYFKMKYSAPYLVFEIPIRYVYNKIYFVSEFLYIDDEEKSISEKYTQILINESEHFISKDFRIDENWFFYLLDEEGLAVYDIGIIDDEIKSLRPFMWVPNADIYKALGVEEQLVYIEPINNYDSLDRNISFVMEIGTIKQSFIVSIEKEVISSKIKALINYKQYKDCYNHIKSRSQIYNKMLIKLCTRQVEDKTIFSNFIPIKQESKINFIQFYNVGEIGDQEYPQVIYPFRMETINTNDSFHIKNYEKELLLSSLFNFLCYYSLRETIQWTFHIVDPLPERSVDSNITIYLKNDHFQTSYNFYLRYAIESEWWKPYIFRFFFLTILIISGIRIYNQRQNKHIQKNSSQLLSFHEFDMRVKMNSKKSLTNYLIEEEGSQDSFMGKSK